MRLRVVASAGMVLGIMLLASAASAFYPDQAVGRGNTQTWVMNLHESLEANVVVSLIDQDGFQTRSMTGTIKHLANDSFPAASSGLSSGWLGSVTVDSLRPIASVQEAVWQDVPAHDEWTGAAFTDFFEGAQHIFFPALSKTERQKSIVTIQCLDTEDCQIEMT
ncbi:MAG TPA: hypothetical protein VJ714_05155, partial [Anaerolineae bacterium]|nr:hypothetical protein [Anaerolineae bacterium]